MRAVCTKCDYDVYSVSFKDLLDTIAADGGTYSMPERDIFCPGCQAPLELKPNRRTTT